jgi:1-phosphofructokinase
VIGIAAKADEQIVKPNLHELEALVGKSLEMVRGVIEASRSLLAGGIEPAAVSMGAEGALFIDDQHAILARTPRVSVRSTVGAGEAMVAGILAGQLGGLSLPQTARLASAFSLDAVTRDESATLSRQRIEAFMREVTIHEDDLDDLFLIAP